MYLIGTMWTDMGVNRYDSSFEIAHPQLIKSTIDGGATLVNHVTSNEFTVTVKLTNENAVNILENFAYDEDKVAIMQELSHFAEGWRHSDSAYGLIKWGDVNHSYIQRVEVVSQNEYAEILEDWDDIDNLCCYLIKPREVAKFTDMLLTDKQKYEVWNTLFPHMVINFERI